MNAIADQKILRTVTLVLPGQQSLDERQRFVDLISAIDPAETKFCVAQWPCGISGVLPFPADLESPPPEMLVAFYRAALAAPPCAVGPLELKGFTPIPKGKGRFK